MRTYECVNCGKSAPLAEAISVDSRDFCVSCCEQFLNSVEPAAAEKLEIHRQTDPTVCHWCSHDGLESEHPVVGGVPTCATCEQRMRNWPLPAWLKWSAAIITIAAIASFAFHYRFFRAYVALRKSDRAMQRGDAEAAARNLEIAAINVPEVKQLQAFAALMRATQLLAENKAAEAVPLLKTADAHHPPIPGVHEMLLNAEASAAFDAKDYETMLAKTRELETIEPNSPLAIAGVASALACKYARAGDPNDKKTALEALQRAKALPEGADQIAPYEQRILFRLETREIIDRDEFDRRFPGGWPPPAGAPPEKP